MCFTGGALCLVSVLKTGGVGVFLRLSNDNPGWFSVVLGFIF